MANTYDLIVIGAGSGGLATAKRAASYGARVAILEEGRVGGTCVIRGCIPKKLMVYAAELGHAIDDARGYGWSIAEAEHGLACDWKDLITKRNDAVARLETTHERLLAEAGVELLRGHGRVAAAGLVEVAGKKLSTRYILIATGSQPILPAVPGIDSAITSDGFFELASQPKRIAVVGGGYIACEFASIARGLGSEVSLIIRRELPLTSFDDDIRRELRDALIRAGIDVHSSSTVASIDSDGAGVTVAVTATNGDQRIEVDAALVYAVGRSPRSEGLGLAEAGVELGPGGRVVVDDDGATNVEGVLAVGDVTGKSPLTPVAIQAGRTIADRLFAGKSATMSYEDIPTAVFSSPPIGTVGLSEAQARERLGDDGIAVYKSGFVPLMHMLTERKARTFVKLIVDKSSDRVVGCHMIGHDAPEIIQGFAVAMKAGATKADFDATVGIHPSAAEEFVTLT